MGAILKDIIIEILSAFKEVFKFMMDRWLSLVVLLVGSFILRQHYSDLGVNIMIASSLLCGAYVTPLQMYKAVNKAAKENELTEQDLEAIPKLKRKIIVYGTLVPLVGIIILFICYIHFH